MPNQGEPPPSRAARTIAAQIGGDTDTAPVIDLGVYQRYIDGKDGA
ncbi:MAG: hypothetical protein M5U23_02960 [Acidimicrobiia bacterium]|nr:hypothetical protein [Acidimicrobiia bacterium]